MRTFGAVLLLVLSQVALSQTIPSVSDPFGRTVVRTQPGEVFELHAVGEPTPWSWTLTPAVLTADSVSVGIMSLEAKKGRHTITSTASYINPDDPGKSLWNGKAEYSYNALKKGRWSVDATVSASRRQATSNTYIGSLGVSYALVGDGRQPGSVVLGASAGWAQQNLDAREKDDVNDGQLSAGIRWNATKLVLLSVEHTAKNDIDGPSVWAGAIGLGPAFVRYEQGGTWIVALNIPLP